MQKLIWRNSLNEEINLTSFPFGITEWKGFSNASLNIQSQKVPFQDGGVFLDALMEERELNVTLAMNDSNNLENRYELRRRLISVLNPKLGEGTLIYTNDYTSKQIKAVPQIPLFENHNSNDSGTPKASLSWTCVSPYWEDVEEIIIELKSGIPTTVKNNGDVDIGIVADLSIANSNNPCLENLTTEKSIQLKGEFANNIEINTNLGVKKIEELQKSKEIIEISVANKICFARPLGISVVIQEGILMYSYNTQDWNFAFYSNTNSINDVIYIEDWEIFIAVGQNVILKSFNGITWDEIEYGNNFSLSKICYGNSKLIISESGITGKIIVSTDGVNFTEEDTNTTASFAGIIYINNYFYASLSDKTIVKSSDAITWETVTTLTSTIGRFCYGKNTLVGIGSGLVVSTSDMETWTETSLSGNHRDIEYSIKNDLFVIIDFSNKILTSSDAITWVEQDSGYTESFIAFYSIVWNSIYKKFIIIGDYGVILTSPDGITWTKVFDRIKNTLTNIIYAKNLYVAVGGSRRILTSPDGITWTSRYYNPNMTLWDLIYNEDKDIFIAVGNNENSSSIILTSSDAITWEERLSVSDSFTYFEHVSFVNIYNQYIPACFYVSGQNSYIYRSSDGINWERSTEASGNVFYNPYLNIAIKVTSNAVQIADSMQTINLNFHTVLTIPSFSSTYRLAFACSESLTIIIIDDKNILTSSDGINWNYIEGTEYIKNIVYAENKFWGITATKLLSSIDGINWSEVLTINNGYGLVYSEKEGQFYIVGSYGMIVKTIDISSQNIIDKLDNNSDMSLKLVKGDNIIRVREKHGNISARLIYRQKYIGV